MQVSIVVLTCDKSVSQTIGIKKTALIPNDIRSRHPNLTLASVLIEDPANLADVLRYFGRFVNSEGVIVLCDNRLPEVGRAITTAFFTVWYDHDLAGKTTSNYFGMIIGKVIKIFRAFSARFDDEKTRKLLILPLRNFRSQDLREIHALFRNGVVLNGEFATQLDALLKSLKSRQRPKVETKSYTTYLIDEEDRYFEYGKERHAARETAIPPHHTLCNLVGNFRFGKRYDADRHFNVSLESGRIDGLFVDCHEYPQRVALSSHINMFPNDFFEPKGKGELPK